MNCSNIDVAISIRRHLTRVCDTEKLIHIGDRQRVECRRGRLRGRRTARHLRRRSPRHRRHHARLGVGQRTPHHLVNDRRIRLTHRARTTQRLRIRRRTRQRRRRVLSRLRDFASGQSRRAPRCLQGGGRFIPEKSALLGIAGTIDGIHIRFQPGFNRHAGPAIVHEEAQHLRLEGESFRHPEVALIHQTVESDIHRLPGGTVTQRDANRLRGPRQLARDVERVQRAGLDTVLKRRDVGRERKKGVRDVLRRVRRFAGEAHKCLLPLGRRTVGLRKQRELQAALEVHLGDIVARLSKHTAREFLAECQVARRHQVKFRLEETEHPRRQRVGVGAGLLDRIRLRTRELVRLLRHLAQFRHRHRRDDHPGEGGALRLHDRRRHDAAGGRHLEQ